MLKKQTTVYIYKTILRTLTLSFMLLTSSTAVYAELVASVDFNEDALRQSVQSRWQTIINHKFGETYNYETPTYKAVFTKNLYINQFSDAIDWSLKDIEGIKYNADNGVATVIVNIETKPRNSKGLDAKSKTTSIKIHEKWLKINGQWSHSSSE